jgi:hypothetical protein
MKPLRIHLSKQQVQRLKELVRVTGLSLAELIRRAIDTAYPPVLGPGPGNDQFRGERDD